ncbi:MAG: hypothetical protein HUU21_26825 [Polyangiaceae bacterium]|nr:hypothetical protein [Polyangiaceae bacterium]NUQ77165.1 hypothetical protein [Polyangiaceae bacterium]
MTTPDRVNLDEILAAARRLPRNVQAELAEALLRGTEAPTAAPGEKPALTMLHGMSERELVALSSAVVAPGQQRRMKALLRKSAQTALDEAERQELDVLLEEADRIALLKAKAAYTLVQLERQRTAAA